MFFCLVRVACQTVSVFYFPSKEVATCSPRLPIFTNCNPMPKDTQRSGTISRVLRRLEPYKASPGNRE